MMQKTKSIELLNKAVADELSAVHQYMYFHFHLDDIGYELLSSIFRRTAITEMMHVETLAERILFLKGDVEMKVAEHVEKIHDVREMLNKAQAMEAKSIDDYNEFAKQCVENSDSATKKIFEELVVIEEEHYDVFDVEVDNLKKFGDHYLALQSIERSKNASNPAAGAE